jgi:hypothetical protein
MEKVADWLREKKYFSNIQIMNSVFFGKIIH